jgi:superfamily II DNA/RNA helicase
MKSLELLIMDEADRLLDMGFKESLMGILQALRQTRVVLGSRLQESSSKDQGTDGHGYFVFTFSID